MHFLTYVFIDSGKDIEAAVAEALAPFSDDHTVPPWKLRIEPDERRAMAEHYGIPETDLGALASRMHDWNGCEGAVDDEGLLALATFNPDATWDWYAIGGRWDGLLPGNAVRAGRLRKSRKLRELLPHDFLTPDGRWHAKSRFVRTGWYKGHLVHTPETRWLKRFRAALDRHADRRVVCVDRHH